MVSGAEATRAFERPVYQALQPYLSMLNVTSIRQAKSILRQKYPNLPSSIRKMPRGMLDRIVADLFQRGVFQSKETAKNYFSRLQSPILIPSIDPVDQISHESPKPKPFCAAENVHPNPPSENVSSQVHDPQASSSSSSATPASNIRDDSVAPATSENTSTIPFTVQHHVLVQVQRILEKACFRFAQQKHPELLEAQSWDCREAVELDQIARQLRASERLDSTAMARLVQPICKLRHTAVHRRILDHREFQRLLWNGQELLALLGDKDALEFVRELRQWIRTTVGAWRGDVMKRTQELDFWDKKIMLDAEDKKKALRDWDDGDVSRHLRVVQKISTGADRGDEYSRHGGSRTPESVSGMGSWPGMQSFRRMLAVCLLVTWSCLTGVGWEDALPLLMSPAKKSH